MKYLRTLIIICLPILLFSCKKNLVTTSSSVKLSFSTDTLSFDTVFTTIGSSTEFFKIYNTNSKPIKISDIHLAGGNASHFRLNIDGVSTSSAKEIEIAPHDSLYVFAAVTVDPNNNNNPFYITDSGPFQTNGNNQKVILIAWGQNAHFYKGGVIPRGTQQTWTNDKPYVIMNNVYVDSNATLTIMPGCRIYNHPGSSIAVFGTLRVLGQPGDTVTFQGDRLEQFFQDLPGNWNGIVLTPSSHDNVITNAVIRDGSVGLQVDSLSTTPGPKLVMSQTIIKNMLNFGIYAINATINASNCLVFNVGQNNCVALAGGTYDFEDCTFADYSNVAINHQNASVSVSNNLTDGNEVVVFQAALNATFQNCIMYGSLDKEWLPGNYTKDGTPFSTTINNCCIKTTENVAGNSIIKDDPKFKDISNDNYHLDVGSPCIGIGKNNGIGIDLDNLARDLNKIDMGCYLYR